MANDALTFTGSPITYRGLTAVDAAGKTVPAHLALTGDNLQITVDDANARYPLTIDPFVQLVQQAELTASDGAANDRFGWNVALSSDGSTLAVGAYAKTLGHTYQGAAYVFTQTAGVWSQQQELTASDGANYDYFGYGLALSSDGHTLAVSAPYKTVGSNSYQGAMYVFTQTAGTWTQQQKLTASDGAANDYFGYGGLALSLDGKTLAVGTNKKTVSGHTNQGTAYVFTQTAGVWSQQQELTASDGAANDNFGAWVSLSADGHALAVAAYGNTVNGNANQGAAYVFTLTAGTWTQQQKLTASDGAASEYFSYPLALSQDGKTLAVVASFKTVSGHTSQGAAYVFTQTAGVWSQQQELTASDGAASDYLGYGGLALSLDGKTLAMGSYAHTVGSNAGQGAAYIFAAPSTTALTATVTVANKAYTGTNSATISGCTLTGVVSPDVVTCDTSGATATFVSGAVGNGRQVNITGLTLSGADASKYTLPSTATSTADITPAPLTATVTANNKVYDTTTSASLTGCNLSGIIGSENVACVWNSATASFASASAGVGKTVTASGLTLTGADAGNYSTPATGTGTASITPLGLTASIGVATRTYDGGTSASLTGCTLTGVIGSDQVSCNTGSATASFASSSVGTGIAVTATGLTLGGNDASNYTAPASTSGSGNITPVLLTATVTASNKTWDGNSAATLTGCNLAGVIIPDAVTCDTRSATATFATSTVGTGIPVSVSGLALTGAAASNYGLASTSATTSADITPPLAIIGLTATPASYTWTSAAKVTLQAHVSSLMAGNKPNGTVNFMDGSTIVATAVGLTSAGIARASVKLAPGSHSLTAVYTGDAQNAGNTSTAQAVTIAKADQATITLTAAASSVQVGKALQLSYSGGNAPGAWVTQAISTGDAVCAAKGRTLRVSGGTGTCIVTATREASTYYNAASSDPLTISVTP